MSGHERKNFNEDLIRDDRGTARTPYDLGALARPGAEQGILTGAEMRILRRRARVSWLWAFWLQLPAIIGIGIFGAFLVSAVLSPVKRSIVFPAIVLTALLVLVWLRVRKGDAPDVRDAL